MKALPDAKDRRQFIELQHRQRRSDRTQLTFERIPSEPMMTAQPGYQNYNPSGLTPALASQVIPGAQFRGAILRPETGSPTDTIEQLLGFDGEFWCVLYDRAVLVGEFRFEWRVFRTTIAIADLVLSAGVSRTRLIFIAGRSSDGALLLVEEPNGTALVDPLPPTFDFVSLLPYGAIVQDAGGDLMPFSMTPGGQFQILGDGAAAGFEWGPRVLTAGVVTPGPATVNVSGFVPVGAVTAPWCDSVSWRGEATNANAVEGCDVFSGPTAQIIEQYPSVGVAVGELSPQSSTFEQVTTARPMSTGLSYGWTGAPSVGLDLWMQGFHLPGHSDGMSV